MEDNKPKPEPDQRQESNTVDENMDVTCSGIIENENANSTKKRSVFVKFPHIFNATTVVAFMALIVSFITTSISYLHTQEQDIQNRKAQLNTLLQRMIALPKENLDLVNKNNNNSFIGQIGSLINQENVLLYHQAINLINELPQERVTAIEYFSLGTCLVNSGNNYEAKIYVEKALEKVTDYETEDGALRTYAMILFNIGEYEKGRETFEKTMMLFDKYENRHFNDFQKLACYIQTEISWAFTEGNNFHFDKIDPHLKKAREHLDKMPVTVGRQHWAGQIDEAEMIMASAISSGGLNSLTRLEQDLALEKNKDLSD